MVLESMLTPADAERNPWKVVVLGAVFGGLSVLGAIYSGLPSQGVVVVALATIAALPLVYNLFNYTASTYEAERFLYSRTLARHFPVVIVLLSLFVGLGFSFTTSFILLPGDVAGKAFDAQVGELKAISSVAQGMAVQVTDRSVAFFERVFFHNLQVLAIIVGLSILYGAAAVAVMAWNSSVIAVFLGTFGKRFAGLEGGVAAAVGTGLAGILPHGSFELLAYATGAIAGGVLSSAVISRRLDGEHLEIVLYDSARLSAAAVFFLAVAAFIESQAVV